MQILFRVEKFIDLHITLSHGLPKARKFFSTVVELFQMSAIERLSEPKERGVLPDDQLGPLTPSLFKIAQQQAKLTIRAAMPATEPLVLRARLSPHPPVRFAEASLQGL